MANVGRKLGTPKTEGRQPGSTNKVSREMIDWLTEVIETNKPQFIENLSKLEPDKHVQEIDK